MNDKIIPERNGEEREQMNSPIVLFALNFLAYAFVFILIVLLVVAACFIGIKWRKSKDAKALTEGNEESKTEE